MRTHLPRLLIALAVITSPASVLAQEIRTVIAEGVGSDPQSSAQNAAQNALTNVVGSFIDASKQLEKRVQIADGIRTQTSQIKTDIREYSQGSIQSFEIVETKKDGSFYRVTAKVGVRIAEFRAYIRKTSEGSVAVDAGLFAEVATAKSQSQSAAKLLADKITAVVSGEVVTFAVGKPVSWRRLDEKTQNEISHKFGRFFSSNIDNIIRIPITVSLDDSFYQNLAATLKSIAKKSLNIVVGDEDLAPCDRLDGVHAQRTGTCVGILDKKLSRGVLYSFDDIDDELGKLLRQGLKISYAGGTPRDMMINTQVSPLQVTLLSAEGEELQNEEYEDDSKFVRSDKLERLWIPRPSSEYGEYYVSWRLFRPNSCCNGPVFFPSFTFYAYLKIDPEIMKKTASIRVRLAR
jgi:hypothetical protein